MKKIIFALVFMLVSMFTMTSCDSNDEKMFIVEEKSASIDDMGPSRFDTLIIHEQILHDKSVKYTFEYHNWKHDIYTVEDLATAYDKHGERVSFSSFDVINIQHVRTHVELIIDRIMEDNNVSKDDKSYIKAAYRQIYLNNYLPFGERTIYNLKKEIDWAENGMVEDPENYDMYKDSYDENIELLDMYMRWYPNVDTANVYKLYV